MAFLKHNQSLLTRLSIIALSTAFAFPSYAVNSNEPPSLQPQMVFSSYFNKKEITYVLKYWPLKFSDYVRGLDRLEEYYVNRLKEASKEDKYFLESEYRALKREIDDKQKSFEQFKDIVDKRISRFQKFENLFPARVGMKIRHAIQDVDNQYKVVKLINDTRRKTRLSDQASAEAEYQLGNIAADNLDFKRALQHYQNAVKLHRNEGSYLLALGNLLNELGETDVAKQFIKQAKALKQPMIMR